VNDMIKHYLKRVLVALSSLLILVACGLSGGKDEPGLPVEGTASFQPVVAAPTQTSLPFADPSATPPTHDEDSLPRRGPGELDLPSISIGIDSLDSYQLSLETLFSGAYEGEDFEAFTAIEYSLNRSQAAELTVLNYRAEEGTPFELSYARTADSIYIKSSEDEFCSPGSPAEAGLESGRSLASLVGSFPGVYGAEQAGNEQVNGIPTMYYTFDERSISAYPGSQASGEVWIAEQGGWVMRYRLSLSSPGSEQTWLYELSQVNSLESVPLPEGCAPVMSDMPIMKDAAGLVRLPGFMLYTTQASIDETALFYRDQLPGLGWTEQPGLPFEDMTTVLFTKGAAHESVVLVSLTQGAAGLEVKVEQIAGE
jgi:hypothetical protein